MKKITTIILALAIAMASFAQKELLPRTVLPQKTGTSFFETTTKIPLFGQRTNQLFGKTTDAMYGPRNAKKWPDVSTLIDEQPAGTLHPDDFRSGYSSQGSNGQAYGSLYTMGIGAYVVAEDAIYLKNPVTSLRNPTNGETFKTWMKLDKIDDEHYVARLPQVICDYTNTYDGNRYIYYVERFVRNTKTGKYAVDNSATDGCDVYFTYKDGMLAMDDSTFTGDYPDAALCITDTNDSWYGYMEAGTKIEPNTYEKTMLPEESTTEQWQFDRNEYYERMYLYPPDWTGLKEKNVTDTLYFHKLENVAIVGDQIYFSTSVGNASFWVKGTIDGNKATFRQQYIGASDQYDRFLWFQPGKYVLYADSSNYDYYGVVSHWRQYQPTETLVADYDPVTKTLTSPVGTSMIFNTSSEYFAYITTCDDVVLTAWEESEGTPEDPVIWSLEDYYEHYGYSLLSVDISNADTNGKYMNEEKIFYNIYLSDDPTTPFEFYDDEYVNYHEDPVNIPYSFDDQLDFFVFGKTHWLNFYFKLSSIDSLGVQAIYYGNGVERKSNIVWYSLVERNKITRVEDIAETCDAIVGTAYYDLRGRRIDRPQAKGIYIRENIYANGRRKAEKIVRR